jgi:hypothetical protein
VTEAYYLEMSRLRARETATRDENKFLPSGRQELGE